MERVGSGVGLDVDCYDIFSASLGDNAPAEDARAGMLFDEEMRSHMF